jgi:hypothetical protein
MDEIADRENMPVHRKNVNAGSDKEIAELNNENTHREHALADRRNGGVHRKIEHALRIEASAAPENGGVPMDKYFNLPGRAGRSAGAELAVQ